MGTVMNGYEMKTTFWQDFKIANVFAQHNGRVWEIEDTFERSWDCWKHDIEYVTELALVTNWMSWALHAELQEATDEREKAWLTRAMECYINAYYKIYDYVYSVEDEEAGTHENFNEDDRNYFFHITD